VLHTIGGVWTRQQVAYRNERKKKKNKKRKGKEN
jgi:hypothetical protein